MSKILVVDDHRLFSEGVRCILGRLGNDVSVVEATTGEEALAVVSQQNDLSAVLLDLYLPDLDGLTVLSRLKQMAPTLPVIMLSASDNPADMLQTIECGASGFIPKTSKAAVMLHAIRLVLDGGLYIPPQIVSAFNPRRETEYPARFDGEPMRHRPSGAQFATTSALTPRQLEVLRHVTDGLSNKQIAQILSITEATAKAHVTAVLKALNVPNRTTAAQTAQKLGLHFPENY